VKLSKSRRIPSLKESDQGESGVQRVRNGPYVRNIQLTNVKVRTVLHEIDVDWRSGDGETENSRKGMDGKNQPDIEFFCGLFKS
jgi:hypothetical protein